MESYRCCFVCLGYFSQHNVGSFMLQHVSQLCLLISCQVASTFGYCQQCCYAHFLYKFSFEHMFSILLDIYLGVESYGNFKFNILKNHQTIFHHGCTILHFHWECMRAPMSIHPHQYLFFVLFLNCSNPSRYEVLFHCVVTLIYISLMTSDVKHLFMCLLTVCVLYIVWGNVFLSPLFIFNWVLIFYC